MKMKQKANCHSCISFIEDQPTHLVEIVIITVVDYFDDLAWVTARRMGLFWGQKLHTATSW